MIFGSVRDYPGKRRQRRSSIWMMALCGACILLASVRGAVAETCTGLQNVGLPDVAIGHKVAPETEWSIGGERIVDAGTEITFHAMEVYDPAPLYRELNSWVDVDADPVACWSYNESATCSWWWHYTGPSDTADAQGFQVSKTFCCPGTRSMRLLCKDQGAWIDDDDTAAAMNVTIPLTLEIDTMAPCESGVHTIPTSNLPTAWATVGYLLEMYPDDITSEHYTYLYSELGLSETIRFLDRYENQCCHLYVMAIHQDNAARDNSGMTYSGKFSVVAVYAHGGLSDAKKESTALHETAHDTDVGGLLECAREDMDCAKHDHQDVTSLVFCNSTSDPANSCLPNLRTAYVAQLDN
jgi:hypothetical protein